MFAKENTQYNYVGKFWKISFPNGAPSDIVFQIWNNRVSNSANNKWYLSPFFFSFSFVCFCIVSGMQLSLLLAAIKPMLVVHRGLNFGHQYLQQSVKARYQHAQYTRNIIKVL